MPKKLAIGANEKNLESACAGLLVKLLEAKKNGRFWGSWKTTLKYFREHVDIPPVFWKRVDKGITRWEQAVRNVAKVHKDQKAPDIMTQHELFALQGGGFALPDDIPPGRQIVEFPSLGGFDVKKKKAKKRVNPLEDPTFWADRFDNLMVDVDEELRLEVVMELCGRYNVDTY